MHVLWYFFSTFFRRAHVWAGMGKVGKMGIRPISADTRKDTYGRNLRSEESWSISWPLGPQTESKYAICQVYRGQCTLHQIGREVCLAVGRSLKDGVLKQWCNDGGEDDADAECVCLSGCFRKGLELWKSTNSGKSFAGSRCTWCPVGEAGFFNWVAEKFGQVLVFEANSIMVMEHWYTGLTGPKYN